MYLRRRTQIMRENSVKCKDEDTLQKRRDYLNIRTQILEQKFGHTFENSSLNSYSLQNRSKTNNKSSSVDSISLNLEMKDNFSRKLNNFTNMSNILNPRISNLNLSRESLNSNHKSVNNKQNYDDIFCAQVHHVFDNHTGSVTRVKFANNDRSLLASCSTDGTLAICQVIPTPATLIYKLEGHKAPIMDMQWSTTNDLIVTASLDATARVWQVTKGKCMRILRDTLNSEILCCCFLPINENMIFVHLKKLNFIKKKILFNFLDRKFKGTDTGL